MQEELRGSGGEFGATESTVMANLERVKRDVFWKNLKTRRDELNAQLENAGLSDTFTADYVFTKETKWTVQIIPKSNTSTYVPE